MEKSKTDGINTKIIWIDGAFGSGKTSVANAVFQSLNNAYLLEFDALQDKYKPNSVFDLFGERYPEAKSYLIDSLINEMNELIRENHYEFLIIPIALINDNCNEKLVNGFIGVDRYHFILTASGDILQKRITEQDNRDVDLALTYMTKAIKYLDSHYPEAIRINTSGLDISNIANEITAIICGEILDI